LVDVYFIVFLYGLCYNFPLCFEYQVALLRSQLAAAGVATVEEMVPLTQAKLKLRRAVETLMESGNPAAEVSGLAGFCFDGLIVSTHSSSRWVICLLLRCLDVMYG
jgi:hypothetical protein